MVTYGGVEVKPHAFLTSALDGRVWSVSLPGLFTPGEGARGIHGIGSCKIIRRWDDKMTFIL
jgi:hypothetical protein